MSVLAPIAVTSALCSTGIAWLTVLREGDLPILLLIRLSALAMACSAVGVWDDDAAELNDAAPLGRPWQRAFRALVALAWLGVSWAVFVAAASVATSSATPAKHEHTASAWMSLGIELAGCTAVTLAAAAWQLRRSGTGGAIAGAIAGLVLGALWLIPALPARWTLLSYPGAPDWSAVHLRWAAITVVAALLAAWWCRDPA